jgi:hypothetical protein
MHEVWISCLCLDRTYRVAVRVHESPLWACIASRALAEALEELPERKKSLDRLVLLSGFRMIAIKSANGQTFDFGKVVTEKDLQSLSNNVVEIVTQGPFASIESSILLRIQSFYSYDALDVSRLHMVCKYFRSVIQSDDVWRDVSTKYKWLGTGWNGSEEEMWNNYRIENGLPYFNIER